MPYETISVSPLTPAIGAEISGLDLSQPMENRQAEEFHRAFLAHKVLFFRDQKLTPEQHKAVGRMFGNLCGIPFVKSLDGHPEIVEIVKQAEERGGYNFGGAWHSDMTYLPSPALAAVLYGVEIPSAGGDTKWANLAASYDALSDGMKTMLGKLSAVHVGSSSYGTASRFKEGDGVNRSMIIDASEEADREVEHPVVRVHPETGEKCLYVNPNFTRRFTGMTEAESKPLLDYLYHHMTRDEFTCRFRWTTGSVAIWDNRATMHRAVNDYDGSRRVVHRVTVAGDHPTA